MRVNTGGSATVHADGNVWLADAAYSDGGGWGHVSWDGGVVDRRASDPGFTVTEASDQDVYTTERWGTREYLFDVPNGTYTIVLHFAETWAGIEGPGERVFDVHAEGVQVVEDLDLYDDVVFATAHRAEIRVTVIDRQLNIEFIDETESPDIDGIEVLPG
jgi:hypothetical protein